MSHSSLPLSLLSPRRVCVAGRAGAGRAAGALLFGAGLLLGAGLLPSGGVAAQESAMQTADSVWLPSLITETPQQGFALAVTLSQKGVATTQPDAEVRQAQRPEYAEDAESLIAVSQVIATHFQTIAAANDYWRE